LATIHGARVGDSEVWAYDQQNRVRVDVHASGQVAPDALGRQIASLGADVTKVYPGYRHGIVTAFVPLSRIKALASMPGVLSVVPSFRPATRVGTVTSQGAAVIKADTVNASGITGRNITVGVISDSYNTARRAATTARRDVLTGDLPRLRNSESSSSPGVKFLLDYAYSGTDEGRAMAQIVHDVAPGADLCFATGEGGQTVFADNIRALRTSPECYADIVVDDLIYYAEPMFSDGVIAQAVDEVTNSTVLDGKSVAYFSAAGNEGKGYSSEFRYVAEADARGSVDAADPTIDLNTVPYNIDTGGGFHNFSTAPGAVDISQEITCAASTCTIGFQWDDPFDVVNGVTTDFNFMVFDANGQYVSSMSMLDDNFATQEPIEFSSTPLSADKKYYIVITRTSQGSQQAKYLRYVSFGGTLTAQYTTDSGSFAATYGHSAARSANGVAAYVYDSVPVATPPYDAYTPQFESYSSAGPVLLIFDAEGNRMGAPEIRYQPNMAAPDGGDTTFFPSGDLANTDYEGNGYPNFFGTSAAAPHAAGAAALMLEKAGGPGTLTPAQIRTALESTASARDVDPGHAVANAAGLSLSATGSSATDPNFFQISWAPVAGGPTLVSMTIDVSAAGLQFDPSTDTGYPLTAGTTTGPLITSASPTAATPILNLTFSGFTPGNVLNFGIDRDVAAIASYGNSADSLAGANFTATFSDGSTLQGTFANAYGTGYSDYDGYGLIDVQAAINGLSS